jgi:transposase-like protein
VGGLRLTGEGSLLGELVKAVLERALQAELTAHLGYEKHDHTGYGTGNSFNGTIAKKVQTGIGPVGLEVPRDRAGTFEPLLIPKRSGRVSGGLDDMIISLYAQESLNYQLRKVTKARGHFPSDDAVVKLLWLAIINIEDKRARERAARRHDQTGKRHDQPARLIEGQRVMGWREALNELNIAYPGRIG